MISGMFAVKSTPTADAVADTQTAQQHREGWEFVYFINPEGLASIPAVRRPCFQRDHIMMPVQSLSGWQQARFFAVQVPVGGRSGVDVPVLRLLNAAVDGLPKVHGRNARFSRQQRQVSHVLCLDLTWLIVMVTLNGPCDQSQVCICI